MEVWLLKTTLHADVHLLFVNKLIQEEIYMLQIEHFSRSAIEGASVIEFPQRLLTTRSHCAAPW
jgi:hypothetical protein